VDWAHFGRLAVGRAERPLWAFVMVLSFSRQVFVRFFLGASMPFFLRGHVEAFDFFGGVARVLLYDNLKSAVLERRGDAIRFNPTLLALAAHYRFEPRPVAVARGNEKGRVERAIRYIRDSFFAARAYADLADLNRQADEWCTTRATERPWPEDKSRTVRDAFAEEKPKLLEHPNDRFPAHERVDVEIGKTPYARFDLNDYSVPHDRTRRTVVVIADSTTVRIVDNNEQIASHPRSWSRGDQVETPEHIERLRPRRSGHDSTEDSTAWPRPPRAARLFSGWSASVARTSAASPLGSWSCSTARALTNSKKLWLRRWSVERCMSARCDR
jgi:hypothetical protein